MKKILLMIATLAFLSILHAEGQTRVIVRTPVRHVVVVHKPVVIAPLRRMIVRPVVTVRRPVVRKRIVVIQH